MTNNFDKYDILMGVNIVIGAFLISNLESEQIPLFILLSLYLLFGVISYLTYFFLPFSKHNNIINYSFIIPISIVLLTVTIYNLIGLPFLINEKNILLIGTTISINILLMIIFIYLQKKWKSKIISNQYEIFKFSKKDDTISYLDKIYNHSFSICNNQFLVFKNYDTINRNEIISFNRETKNIRLKKTFKSININQESIAYLLFKFDCKYDHSTNLNPDFYQVDFYFQTIQDNIMHITSIETNNEKWNTKEDIEYFRNEMVQFASILSQELSLDLKNLSDKSYKFKFKT